jgi:hypothetical protein
VSKNYLLESLLEIQTTFNDTKKMLNQSSHIKKKLTNIKSKSMNIADLFILSNEIDNLFESSLFTLNIILDTWNIVIGECYRRYRLCHQFNNLSLEKKVSDQSDHRYLNRIISSHSNALSIATGVIVNNDLHLFDSSIGDVSEDFMDDFSEITDTIITALDFFNRNLTSISIMEKQSGMMPNFQLSHTINRLETYNVFFDEFIGICKRLSTLKNYTKKTLIHQFLEHKNMQELISRERFYILHDSTLDTMLFEMDQLNTMENIIVDGDMDISISNQIITSSLCNYILFSLNHIRYYHTYQYLFNELRLMMNGLDTLLDTIVEFYCCIFASNKIENYGKDPIQHLVDWSASKKDHIKTIVDNILQYVEDDDDQKTLNNAVNNAMDRIFKNAKYDHDNALHETAFKCVSRIIVTHLLMLSNNKLNTGLHNNLQGSHEFINQFLDDSDVNSDIQKLADQRIIFSMNIIMRLLVISKFRMENENQYKISMNTHLQLYNSKNKNVDNNIQLSEMHNLYNHFNNDTPFQNKLNKNSFDNIFK